jgi:hypothetical protein
LETGGVRFPGFPEPPLVDFTDASDLAVFIDEQRLAVVEKRMWERGYFEGKEMAMAFNMLRANDFDLELRCRQLSPRVFRAGCNFI